MATDLLSHPKSICYSSFWRGLPEGLEHPRHYVQLSGKEIAELISTGGFTLPDSDVPDSVRAWRKTQDAAVDVVLNSPAFDVPMSLVLPESADA